MSKFVHFCLVYTFCLFLNTEVESQAREIVVQKPRADPRQTCNEVDPNVPQTPEMEFVEFQRFIKRYGREFHNLAEFHKRYRVFRKNYKLAKKTNNNSPRVNKYADLTEYEIRCWLSMSNAPRYPKSGTDLTSSELTPATKK